MRQHRSIVSNIVPLLASLALAAPLAHADSIASAAQDRVSEAVHVVDQMKQSPHLARMLMHARGLFIVPHYDKAGFVAGSQSRGVVLVRHNDTWSYPAFFNIGGGSLGAQAGGESGAVAMILMTPKAVHKFESHRSTWSLDRNAGLTVVTYSRRVQPDTGRADVILWSDTSGLYGGLTASVTGITPDMTMDRAYYGHGADSRRILAGSMKNTEANPLRNALLTRVSQR